MPVHLGSMGESIKTVIARNPAHAPGDVYVLNDPYHGGTHLPDVTVVTPVFSDAATASRSSTSPRAATTPTSAASRRARCRRSRRRIDEEGVLIDNFKLVDDGASARGRAARRCWRAAPYPARNPTAEHRRPARADRRQREGRAGAARDGRAVRPRHRARLHAPRAGQRRGDGAPRRSRALARRRASTLPLDNGARIRVDGHASIARRAARRSTSPAPARSCRTTSTRRRR